MVSNILPEITRAPRCQNRVDMLRIDLNFFSPCAFSKNLEINWGRYAGLSWFSVLINRVATQQLLNTRALRLIALSKPESHRKPMGEVFFHFEPEVGNRSRPCEINFDSAGLWPLVENVSVA